MQLDSYTLLVASCGLLVLLGLAFVFVWLRDRRSVWLLWWGGPLIVAGVALIFYLRSPSQDFAAIAFGNAARIFAVGCLWYGIRLFEGRRLPWGALSALAVIWVALCYYPPFMDSLTMRVTVVSLIMSALCTLCTWELWGEHEDGLRSRLPTMLVFASGGVLLFVRALTAAIIPFASGVSFYDPLWLSVFSYLAVGHALFAAIFFLTMTMERREAEQRSFALSDPLTGLLNRRAFSDLAQRMARRRAGQRDPMALLVLDLDHFKDINDRFGHEAGDRMLKAFAEASEDSVRPTDQLFRMGGEEFCFVLSNTSLEDAITIADRVRRSFEAVVVATTDGAASTTVSIGIAATSFAISIETLLAAADAAVYEAKARGRNRVVVAAPSTLLRGPVEAEPLRRRA